MNNVHIIQARKILTNKAAQFCDIKNKKNKVWLLERICMKMSLKGFFFSFWKVKKPEFEASDFFFERKTILKNTHRFI